MANKLIKASIGVINEDDRDYYGKKRLDILPSYWQPKWNAFGKLESYVDPSARTLNVYEKSNTPEPPPVTYFS
jgi:DNA-directed RNA polymerase beta subunit